MVVVSSVKIPVWCIKNPRLGGGVLWWAGEDSNL